MLRTRGSLTPLALAGGLIVLLVLLATGCGSGSSSSAQPAASAHGDPESIFEDELHLHADPSGTLNLLHRLGVSRVRVYLAWKTIAPGASAQARPAFNAADPAAYPASAWSIYDRIVRAAAAQHIGLDFTIGGPVPQWALGPGAPPNPFSSWKPSPADFGAFAQAAGARYDGTFKPAGDATPLPRVDFWSVWNEPNYGPGLAPQATQQSTVEVSPNLYRGLLDAAWRALEQTGHGQDTILIGEVAPRGQTSGNQPGNFSGMVPLRFVRALYCVDDSFRALSGAAASARGCPPDASGSKRFAGEHPALFRASGFAVHPYPQGNIPPNVRTPGEPDFADLAALPSLASTLDRALAAHGVSRQLPIYSTEFGYQTNPPEKIARAIDPNTAAIYLNWSEYLTWRDPRIRSYDQYLLTDPPAANSLGGFATGLWFSNSVPKATYPAFRMPIYLPAGGTGGAEEVEIWGCVRPAPDVKRDTGQGQSADIQFRPSGSGAFKTLRSVPISDPRGYFDVRVALPQSGAVRIAWAYPDGTKIYSRNASFTRR
ncbi:MAG: hypothetical protein JO153_12020 [Solirubrobacterales bacterium]|nr:hypothetical protein [Solirubrobacterales bacterium]